MKDLVITRLGEQLITKALTENKKITFTKINVTDQDYTQTDLKTLERLLNVRASVNVEGVTVSPDRPDISVYANLNNNDVTTGFYIRIVGLYAKLEGGTEMLFAVCLGDGEGKYDFMPAFLNANYVGLSYKFYIAITDTDIVNITVDPSGAVSMQQLTDALNDKADAVHKHVKADITDLFVDNTATSGSENLITSNAVYVGLSGREPKHITVTGVLAVGDTTLTLSNSAININSTIDIYTDAFGVSPKDVTVSAGNITLEFDSRDTELNVKVVVS